MRKIKSITEGKTNHNVNTPPQMVHVILTKKNEIKKNAQLATCYSGKKKKKSHKNLRTNSLKRLLS